MSARGVGPGWKTDRVADTTQETPVADQTPDSPVDPTTRQAVEAITAALHDGRDVAEFIAHALCYVAAVEGGIDEVLRNRSGSWEAADIRHLMEGTAGVDGEYLDNYRN